MVSILLYGVIGRIGMMTLHVEIVDEGSDMGGRTWGCFHDVLTMISCPHDLGGYMHMALCIYIWKHSDCCL